MPCEMPSAGPLYVDMDGTLWATNVRWQSLILLLRTGRALLWRVPFWLMKSKACVKRELVSHNCGWQGGKERYGTIIARADTSWKKTSICPGTLVRGVRTPTVRYPPSISTALRCVSSTGILVRSG
jgi:hypothetical protein